MKKVVVMFVSLALFADEKQKNVNTKQPAESKIIACGQGTEKRSLFFGLINPEVAYDWYLFDDDILLLASEEMYKQEKVIVESTKKNGQVEVTKITMKDNPELISDLKTGKVMRGTDEIGEVNQGTDCMDLKDFYESIRRDGKEYVSRNDILIQNIQKYQQKTDHFKRARSASDKARNSK